MASTARIEELRKKYEENQRRYFAPLANEYRKAGQLEEAIALCRAWLPQQPGHMSGHIVFGQTLFESGELTEAQSVFETALELDPENLIALRHLGDIARQHGDLGAARSWYQRVLDADPRNDEIAALLAELDALAVSPDADFDSEPATTSPSDSSDAALAVEASPAAEAATLNAEEAAWGSTAELEREVRGASGDEASTLFDETVGTVAFDRDTAPLELETGSASGDSAANADDAGTIAGISFDAAVSSGSDAAETIAAFSLDASVASGSGASGDEEPALASGVIGEDEFVPAGSAATDEQPASGRDAAAEERSATPPDAGSELGLEVMEFVPPPREPSRTPRADPGPFDGHLLGDDADTSSATPAAFVTETMAELYLQQGFRDEALGVYRQLLKQSPDDEALRDRVAQLEGGSKSSVGMAAISEEVIESAQRRQVAHTPPSMRAFLAKLAVRRAPRREAAEGEGASAESSYAETASEASADADTDSSAPEPPVPEALSSDVEVDTGAEEPAVPTLEALSSDADAWQLPPDDAAADASVVAEEPAGSPSADSEAGDADWMADSRPSGDEMPGMASDDRPMEVPAPDAPGSGVDESRRSTPEGTGAIGALFAGGVIQAGDEAAASALAAAFSAPSEKPDGKPLGRPTRAANSEISLDHVFRESGARPATQKERNNFSFDQFFSENASGAAANAETSGGPDDAPPPDDIEQFNSWLEGLKKK